MKKKPAQLDKLVDLTKLSRAEARVEIAKDVLAALDARYIHTGTKHQTLYLKVRVRKEEHARAKAREKAEGYVELRDLVAQAEDCQVCARGALLIAVVARDNEMQGYSATRYPSWSFVVGADIARLAPYFSKTELFSLEIAFEELLDHSEEARTQFLKDMMQHLVDTQGNGTW